MSDQLDAVLDKQLQKRLGWALDDVVARAVEQDATDFPFGETDDVWEYGDLATRRFPYDPHFGLNQMVKPREDAWPNVAPDGGPAHPGDHAYDQCEVMLDSRRIVVTGSVYRGRLDVVVGPPDRGAASSGAMSSAQLVVRAASNMLAEVDERGGPAGRAERARNRVTQWVRRALVDRARR